MRKFKSMLLVALFAISMTSCMSLEHTIGAGAQGNSTSQQKQWYALYGLVPINNVDSQAMAGGSEDYTIVTEYKFIDSIISMITGMITVNVQTVEVTK